MSKKIIAILTIITILFVCVFAACDKKESLYSDGKDYDLVTDLNGEKVLGENGELLVYATDEKGKHVTDESGEKVTVGQQFEPMQDGNIIEDYGFKVILPDGWKTDETKVNSFINKEKNESCEITVVKYFYDDYYEKNKDMYKMLKDEGINVTWEDDVKLGKDFKNACRFTMENEGETAILYFFENSGNVYKILFGGENVDSKIFVVDTVEFCKAMTFKGFAYYSDITAVSDKK